ncbi:MAG: sensor histidine kinase [Acidocella sp.]|uniref:sensor histidine kinase n=1 Tax=Acidocella sp. TaxID=50710 RepID=UPI003FC0FEE2
MQKLLDKAWPAAFALFLGMAALPSLVFLVLVLLGDLPLYPALLAWGTCAVVGGTFSILLGRDLVVMSRLLRALRSAAGALSSETMLLVPGMRQVGQEAIRLVHAERLSRARLLASVAEDRALVERLPDPLLKLDEDGKILWRNDSAISGFGGEIAALLRHPDVRDALAEAAEIKVAVRREVALSVPVARDLDVTMIPAGGPVYMLVNDRTHERALEKMRADFVANASHELRTPLASLIGFIETLRGPAADDPEAQQRFLGIMAEQAARMQRVIGDLLNLSRIEITEHSPPKELVHLPLLLERIVAGMEPMLKANDARLEVAVPADLPKVPADADQLTQVFTNLLDNALKYGKRGGVIKLTASIAPDTRFEPGGVAISVADDGIGIPREHIPRLTERFYRVDKGRSRAIGGTGLGLAIVKHVINRHRGRLFIDSDAGKGSVFTIWLPGRGS